MQTLQLLAAVKAEELEQASFVPVLVKVEEVEVQQPLVFWARQA